MQRYTHIVSTLVIGGIAASYVDLSRVFVVVQPVTVCLSIMAAAVFVRLNRGMPTLDWKSLKQNERVSLTKSITDLTAEYGKILAVIAVSIMFSVGLTGLGLADAHALDTRVQRALVGLSAGLLYVCLTRMIYVVWRDYDVVRLQKELIDASGEREQKEAEIKKSDNNLRQIEQANLAKSPNPPAAPWPN